MMSEKMRWLWQSIKAENDKGKWGVHGKQRRNFKEN